MVVSPVRSYVCYSGKFLRGENLAMFAVSLIPQILQESQGSVTTVTLQWLHVHCLQDEFPMAQRANMAPRFLAHKHSVLSYGEGENGVHVNEEVLASAKVEAKCIGDKINLVNVKPCNMY